MYCTEVYGTKTKTPLTLSQQVSIRCKDIIAMTKEKTALVIPNAIEIRTEGEKHFLTSFASRDKTYLMLFRIWQNALMDQVSGFEHCCI